MRTKKSVILCIFLLSMVVLNVSYAIENQSSIEKDSVSIDLLIQDLGSSDTSIQSNAAKNLVAIGDPAVEPLIAALESENYNVRENAALVLGKIGNETAIEPLIEALSIQEWEDTEGERDFGRAVETALGSFGEAAVGPLAEFLDGKEYSHSVGHAIAALEPIGEPAVPVLVQLLYTELRVEAAYHLRMIGEPAEDYLIPLLDDEDPRVRRRVAEALVGTTNPEAVEPLTELLDDENQYVRTFAKMALERMETANTPVESTLYGREREFFIESEKREWMDSLVPIVKGRSVYIEPYFYPDGPVISYGLNYQGYLTVGLLIGSDVNESYMAEIYGVIDAKAWENGVEEVPVLFSFESMPVLDEAIEENVPAEDLEIINDESENEVSMITGFMALMLVILFIGILLGRKK